MNLSRIKLDPDAGARLLGLMLVAWQPFISGARLPTLLLLLLGVAMLVRKQIDFSSQAVQRLGIVFLLLLGPVLLSIPGSYEPQGSAAVAAALAAFFIVGLALLRGFAAAESRDWLQRWLLIVLGVWLVDGLIQYAFGRDLLGIPIDAEGRILGPFGGNLHFGLFLAVLSPVILWRMAAERPLRAILILALIGFIAGMSGARSNAVYLILAGATLLIQFRWRYRLLMAAGIAAAFAVALLASPAFTAKLGQFSGHGSAASAFKKTDLALSGRMTIWETAAEMVKDRPLTGVGANAFAEAYDHYAKRPDDPFRSQGGYPGGVYHAHQMYVSVAAESGLIGLAGLVAVVALCIAWYFRAPPGRRRQALPFAAPLAVVAFPIQSQPILYTIWWFPILLLMLCAYLAALAPERG